MKIAFYSIIFLYIIRNSGSTRDEPPSPRDNHSPRYASNDTYVFFIIISFILYPAQMNGVS